MFTGLVRYVGTVIEAVPFGKGSRFRIEIGNIAENAKVGQSIAINGVCLTATSVNSNEAAFDAVAETVARSNLGTLRAGSKVNLEPALRIGEPLDGHLMLGHVDVMASVLDIKNDSADNRTVSIQLPEAIRALVAEKGSVAINGISLTVSKATDSSFDVAIIPQTWKDTTMANLAVGDYVNLEVDVFARYIARILQFRNDPAAAAGDITLSFLQENGFA